MSVRLFSTTTTSTEIYTLSLHDALPILYIDYDVPNLSVPRGADTKPAGGRISGRAGCYRDRTRLAQIFGRDRKSTRLNSSHVSISYAVFCLKKKKRTPTAPLSPESQPRG